MDSGSLAPSNTGLNPAGFIARHRSAEGIAMTVFRQSKAVGLRRVPGPFSFIPGTVFHLRVGIILHMAAGMENKKTRVRA